MSATTYGWLVLGLPLAGSLIVGLGWRWLPGRAAGWIGTGAVAASFLCALGALWAIQDEPEGARQTTSALWDYASVGGLEIQLGILVDPLSVFMALVVSGVSALINLYSVAYMRSDAGYARFFSYLCFFVFSMLLLVLAGNLVILIVGWALVGFASYALISFWYRRRTAVEAGMKAFVLNVVGDVGLVLATFLFVRELGTVDFLEIFELAPGAFAENDPTLVAACLLLLVGAFAKSAQVPLHTWLPDAMEGPTPVSSLIHAATMVTAGVYLIARAHPLFELAPTAAAIAAGLGLATVVIAATIALVVTDLKRIIAYSTMSQVGYMVVAVSIGAYTAGLFHLMTHAFFKALLFMAAGSVIAAMANVQNIDRMGGFRRAMPFTFVTMVIGCLALAGFPLTAGFFSKDEIIAFAAERGGAYWVLAIGMYLAALLTAFYAFRIVYRVFGGEMCPEARELAEGGLHHAEPENPVSGEPEDTDIGYPGPEHHVAERAWPMRVAMGALALGALFGGLLQVPELTSVLERFFEPTFAGSPLFEIHPPAQAALIGMGVAGLIALAGIGLAHLMYAGGGRERTAGLERRLGPVHSFLAGRWYFDELIDLTVVRPTQALGRGAQRYFERLVVDGIVNGAIGAVRGSGGVVRAAQSGFLRSYALLLVGGAAAVLLYFLIVSA